MKYDEVTKDYLLRSGLSPSEKDAPVVQKKLPYTAAGLPGLLVREMPELEGTNTSGFVLTSNRKKDLDSNRAMQQNIFVAPKETEDVAAHEIEHMLARQNLGTGSLLNEKFDELIGDKGAKRSEFVHDAIKVFPYLEKKYGLRKNAYFDANAMRAMSGGNFATGFYEVAASLAGLEATKNIDLTKDPVLRDSLFKDKNVRETYNAVTGLRQTRLDPRDIPPHTRIKEKEEGVMSNIKKKLGFAWGGHVPGAGNEKLI